MNKDILLMAVVVNVILLNILTAAVFETLNFYEHLITEYMTLELEDEL